MFAYPRIQLRGKIFRVFCNTFQIECLHYMLIYKTAYSCRTRLYMCSVNFIVSMPAHNIIYVCATQKRMEGEKMLTLEIWWWFWVHTHTCDKKQLLLSRDCVKMIIKPKIFGWNSSKKCESDKWENCLSKYRKIAHLEVEEHNNVNSFVKKNVQIKTWCYW